jgi:hypothetical protein
MLRGKLQQRVDDAKRAMNKTKEGSPLHTKAKAKVDKEEARMEKLQKLREKVNAPAEAARGVGAKKSATRDEKVGALREKVAALKGSGDKKKLAAARGDLQGQERMRKIEAQAKKEGKTPDDVIRERNAAADKKVKARLREKYPQLAGGAEAKPKPSDRGTPASRIARPVDPEVAFKVDRAMARKNGDIEAEKRADKALKAHRKMMRGG